MVCIQACATRQLLAIQTPSSQIDTGSLSEQVAQRKQSEDIEKQRREAFGEIIFPLMWLKEFIESFDVDYMYIESHMYIYMYSLV